MEINTSGELKNDKWTGQGLYLHGTNIGNKIKEWKDNGGENT